jgi:dTDP-4-dehydrorhamnose reductase
MKNYLVVGRGWVGNKMLDELHNRNHNASICSHENVFEVIENESFDCVINCAGYVGYPNVDACEYNKPETIKGNSLFPIELYEVCNKLNIKFAHWSSGCIYEGEIDDVNAAPNFFGSIYSTSKGISDEYLKSRALVFRVRLPFDSTTHPKNLLTKLLHYSKTGKLVEGGYNSITDIDEAVRVACDLIEEEATGPYNLVNDVPVTTHDIAELLGLNAEWFSDEEFKAATLARRSNCVIPSYQGMGNTFDALKRAINIFHST